MVSCLTIVWLTGGVEWAGGGGGLAPSLPPDSSSVPLLDLPLCLWPPTRPGLLLYASEDIWKAHVWNERLRAANANRSTCDSAKCLCRGAEVSNSEGWAGGGRRWGCGLSQLLDAAPVELFLRRLLSGIRSSLLLIDRFSTAGVEGVLLPSACNVFERYNGAIVTETKTNILSN